MARRLRNADLLIEFQLEFELGNVGKIKSCKNVIFNDSNGIFTVRIEMGGWFEIKDKEIIFPNLFTKNTKR